MSGSRGRKNSSHRPDYQSRQNFHNPRWPNHQQYYDQNMSLQRGWSNSSWNGIVDQQGYNSWPNSNPHFQVWPQVPYNHQRTGGDSFPYEPFPQRFTNDYNTPHSQFAERSLAYLNQTPLNELTRSGHRDAPNQQGSSSSDSKHNRPENNDRGQSARGRETTLSTTRRIVITTQEKSATQTSSIKVSEKTPIVPTPPTSFMPPNDDLRNKVKASLKMMAATKDQVPVTKTAPVATEPIVPSSPQKQREARVPAIEGSSPSTRQGVAARSQRRISQSIISSPATNESSLLEGIGFIQKNAENPSSDQTPKTGIAGASLGSDESTTTTQESESGTAISKDQLNRYIRSMDNHQRRQLVDQPRAIVSQYMLNHLVQENQTARARQLTSLRFRVNSSELEMTARSDSHVVLPEELVEQIKEFLAQNDEEPINTSLLRKETKKTVELDSEEEEIQVLEPPPKTPPLCIDLDLDEQPPVATSSSLISSAETSTTSQQTEKQSSVPSSIDSRNDNLNKTTRIVPVTEVSHQPPLNSSSSSVGDGASNKTLKTPAPVIQATTEVTLNSSSESRSPDKDPAKIARLAEIAKKRAARKLERKKRNQELALNKNSIKTTKLQQKLERMEKIANDKAKKEAKKLARYQKELEIAAKTPQNSKKHPRPTKSPNNSPLLSTPITTFSQLPSQTQVSALAQDPSQATVATPINALDATSNKETTNIPALSSENIIDSQPNSGQPRNGLKFLLEDLQIEEQEGKSRITIIDRTIEDLQRERKILTDRVLELKQKQFDLLSSSLTNARFERDIKEKGSTCSGALSMANDELVDAEPPKAAVDEVVPPSPIVSTQLLSLMHQLEENGVQVALGELQLLPDTPSSELVSSVSSSSSGGSKRKRATQCDDDVSQLKKKTSAPSSPVQDVPSFDAAVSASMNSLVAQSILPSDIPVVAQSPPPIATVPPTLEPSGPSLTKGHALVRNPSISTHPSIESQATKTSVSTGPGVSSTSVLLTPALPQKTSIDSNIAKKAVEGRADAATPRLVESSLQNAPLPATQGTQKASPRNPPQVTSSVPPKNLSQVPEPKTIEKPKNAVSNAATSLDPPKELTTNECSLTSLPSHATSIRCVFVNGPCIFTASEDGTVHVYDIATKGLSMRILGHMKPVTWLYAVSLNTPSSEMRTLKAPEYLNHLNLITGSEDTYVRQFSLETGKLLHEKECRDAVTCVAGHKILAKLYIGSKEGQIFTYNPKANVLRTVNFRAAAEVICLKVARIRSKKAIIVAARRTDPVIYDLDTEEVLFELTSNIPSNSVYCISTNGNFVYCCDANKNIFTFDMNNRKNPLYQTDTIPSAALSCYHDGNRFLILGCIDGVIRVLDVTKKSPNSRLFNLPGQNVKTLTCMKVSGNKIVLGSLDGFVGFRFIPNLEDLSKKEGNNQIII